MYTYNLFYSGYEILKDNKIIIRQMWSPNYADNRIMSILTTEQISKLLIAKLNLNKTPIITFDEELELSNGIVSNERIQKLANG